MDEIKLTKTFTVTENMLAETVGSGTLAVLATPAVSAMFEGAAAELAQQHVPAGCTTVGAEITVRHTAPTLCGAVVTVEAELVAQDGRTFTFRLSARDEAGPVASGKHTRVSVFPERFMEKAEQRKSAAHEV